MKKAIFTTGGALFFWAASAAWHVETVVDDMTDKTRYSILTTGEPIAAGMSIYRPELHVRLEPIDYDPKTDRLRYRSEVYFTIEVDGLRRGESSVQVRFDRQKPTHETVTSSGERRAGFFGNPAGFVEKLKSSTNVIVRYTTTLDNVRTAKFHTSGLLEQMKTVKKLVRDNRQ